MGSLSGPAQTRKVLNYLLLLSPRARRALDAASGTIFFRLQLAINGLVTQRRPPGCVKLAGGNDQWRIRIGDYRVIYTVDDDSREVLILRVGHRREVYRG